MSLTRRLFLRHSAAAGAIGAGGIQHVAAAKPELTPRDLAVWHMRELERLAIEDGAASAFVSVVARPHGDGGTYDGFKMLVIDHSGDLVDDDGMFSGGRS